MADFTFSAAPVLIETTGEFAIGASGVLRPAGGGSPVPVYDLNGSPITGIVVGPKGAHQAFMADIPNGVLDFGSVLLVAESKEQREAGFEALTLAQSAITTADDAAVTVSQLKIAVEVIKAHDGTSGGGTRPTGYARVRWVGGAARPTNMATGDIWEHNA